MGIGAAMVDTAVVLRKVQTGTVDGAPRFAHEDVFGNVFRCRYTPGNESESRTESSITRRRPATLLIAKRDNKGLPVNIRATDRVRITSKRFGVIDAEIQGTPTKISKKTSYIAFTANLTKVIRNDPA